jgi:hypothetical protein
MNTWFIELHMQLQINKFLYNRKRLNVPTVATFNTQNLATVAMFNRQNVATLAGGDKRKRAHSGQRRVGQRPDRWLSPRARVAREGELSLVRALPPLQIYPNTFY